METEAVFFTAEAREDTEEVSLGPNCPVQWITEDNKVHDATLVKLKNYFLGKEEEWLFCSFGEMVHTFDPSRLKSCTHWRPEIPTTSTANAIISTLVVLFNWMIDCIDSVNSMEIKRLLYMRFDSIVPMKCAVDAHVGVITDAKAIHLAEQFEPGNLMDIPCEGNIPDAINDMIQCTYWNETKTKFSPIIHLICKALPQRCQIRNLRTYILCTNDFVFI